MIKITYNKLVRTSRTSKAQYNHLYGFITMLLFATAAITIYLSIFTETTFSDVQ